METIIGRLIKLNNRQIQILLVVSYPNYTKNANLLFLINLHQIFRTYYVGSQS